MVFHGIDPIPPTACMRGSTGLPKYLQLLVGIWRATPDSKTSKLDNVTRRNLINLNGFLVSHYLLRVL